MVTPSTQALGKHHQSKLHLTAVQHICIRGSHDCDFISLCKAGTQRWSLHTHTKKMVEFDSFGQGSNHFTLLSPKMTFMNMLCITRLGETHLVSVSFPKDFLSTEPKESNMLKWERQLHTRSTGTAESRHSNDGGAHAQENKLHTTDCTAGPPSLSVNPPPQKNEKGCDGKDKPIWYQTLVIHLGQPPTLALIRLLSNCVG